MNTPGFTPPPAGSFEPVPVEKSGATKNDAIVIFVLGLLGLVVCQILAPVAWRKGNTYRNVCMIGGMQPDGLGVAGRWLGIVGTVLLVLQALWLVFFWLIPTLVG